MTTEKFPAYKVCFQALPVNRIDSEHREAGSCDCRRVRTTEFIPSLRAKMGSHPPALELLLFETANARY
jgi:hypothetical protein